MPQGEGAKLCSACTSRNISSRLRLFQVNFEEAILLCPREDCTDDNYPATFVERNVEDIRDSKRKGKRSRRSRTSKNSDSSKSASIEKANVVIPEVDLNNRQNSQLPLFDAWPSLDENFDSFDWLMSDLNEPAGTATSTLNATISDLNTIPCQTTTADAIFTPNHVNISVEKPSIPNSNYSSTNEVSVTSGQPIAQLSPQNVPVLNTNATIISQSRLLNPNTRLRRKEDHPLPNNAQIPFECEEKDLTHNFHFTLPSMSLRGDCENGDTSSTVTENRILASALNLNSNSSLKPLDEELTRPVDPPMEVEQNTEVTARKSTCNLVTDKFNSSLKLNLPSVGSSKEDPILPPDNSSNLLKSQILAKTNVEADTSLLEHVFDSKSSLPLWQNKHNMCWLDALLCLIVHNTSLRKAVGMKTGPSLIRKLVETYCSAVRSEKGSKIGKSLESIREEVFRLLVLRLRGEKDEREGIVAALPVLLAVDPDVSQLFAFPVSWKSGCQQCGQQMFDAYHKFLPSFGECSEASKSRPKACSKCLKQNERFPTTFAVHFVNGLPHARLKEYDFRQEGMAYRLTAVVQYQESRRHFITWIRHFTEEKWLCCDDMQSSLARFETTSPTIPPEELHILVWERTPDVSVTNLSFREVVLAQEESMPCSEVAKEDPTDAIPCHAPQQKLSNGAENQPSLEHATEILQKTTAYIPAVKKIKTQAVQGVQLALDFGKKSNVVTEKTTSCGSANFFCQTNKSNDSRLADLCDGQEVKVINVGARCVTSTDIKEIVTEFDWGATEVVETEPDEVLINNTIAKQLLNKQSKYKVFIVKTQQPVTTDVLQSVCKNVTQAKRKLPSEPKMASAKRKPDLQKLPTGKNAVTKLSVLDHEVQRTKNSSASRMQHLSSLSSFLRSNETPFGIPASDCSNASMSVSPNNSDRSNASDGDAGIVTRRYIRTPGKANKPKSSAKTKHQNSIVVQPARTLSRSSLNVPTESQNSPQKQLAQDLLSKLLSGSSMFCQKILK